MTDSIYRDFILEHFQHPHHRGELESPTISERDTNPLCGDDITIDIMVDARDRVENCMFHGHGCAISQAAADILCDEIIGRPVSEVLEMTKEDMLDLLGIELGPVRVKCGLLAYKIVKMGLVRQRQVVG
jgi:nitrogen fixation NifU-like protein